MAEPEPPLVVIDLVPSVGSSMSKVPLSPAAVFWIVIVASFVSVKTHVTLSPGTGVTLTPSVIRMHSVASVVSDHPGATAWVIV